MASENSIVYIKIGAENEPFLKEMLFTALFIPPGEPMLPKETVGHPDLLKYYHDWGRMGDIGVLAKANGVPIAACWSRLFPPESPGYGFVAPGVPELTIAVQADWRNKGIGQKMLDLLCEDNKAEGFKSLCLSVDKRNKAHRLYQRLGFDVLEEKGTAFTMVKQL